MLFGRILFDFILFLLAILLPGWSFFLLGTIFSYFFSVFWEFILVSLIVDVLYGFPVVGFYEFNFIFTVLSAIVVVIVSITKNKIRLFK